MGLCALPSLHCQELKDLAPGFVSLWKSTPMGPTHGRGHTHSARSHCWGFMLGSPVLKFLRILSVNLQPVSEVIWDIGAYGQSVEPGSHALLLLRMGSQARAQLLVLCFLMPWALLLPLPQDCSPSAWGSHPYEMAHSPSHFDHSGLGKDMGWIGVKGAYRYFREANGRNIPAPVGDSVVLNLSVIIPGPRAQRV